MLNTLRFITSHPLTEDHKIAAMLRWLKWQIGSRLVPGAAAVPYAGDSRLLVSPGMTGATGNIYCGLHEFSDMAFLLHFLRPGELFLDVGANVGSYTVLAGKVVGARVVAIEPVPETFNHLMDNVYINRLNELVHAKNIALGAVDSVLTMTSDQDTVNHAVSDSDEEAETITVLVKQLDGLFKNEVPSMIKIDVEGYETEVIKGGQYILSSPDCKAVIMELNGSGNRYGYNEVELHQSMLRFGFSPYQYLPFERAFVSLGSDQSSEGNTLYLRDLIEAQYRVKSAPRVRVLGQSF